MTIGNTTPNRHRSKIRGIGKAAAAASALLLLASCGNEDEAGQGEISEAPAVPMINSSGEIVGEVRGSDSREGAVLLVTARGLPPGEHAIHIHDAGLCETPGFTSAGPHWNPTGAQHGLENSQGPHRGDLRNITVAQDGTLSTRIVIPGTYLRSVGPNAEQGAVQLLDANGASVVIHAGPDDYRTDPSGASGDRIACAVLGSPGADAMADGNAVATQNQAGANEAAANAMVDANAAASNEAANSAVSSNGY